MPPPADEIVLTQIETIDLTGDDDEEMKPAIPRNATSSMFVFKGGPIQIYCLYCKKETEDNIKKGGGNIVGSVEESDYILVREACSAESLKSAIEKRTNQPVVFDYWILDCVNAGRRLDCRSYEFLDRDIKKAIRRLGPWEPPNPTSQADLPRATTSRAVQQAVPVPEARIAAPQTDARSSNSLGKRPASEAQNSRLKRGRYDFKPAPRQGLIWTNEEIKRLAKHIADFAPVEGEGDGKKEIVRAYLAKYPGRSEGGVLAVMRQKSVQYRNLEKLVRDEGRNGMHLFRPMAAILSETSSQTTNAPNLPQNHDDCAMIADHLRKMGGVGSLSDFTWIYFANAHPQRSAAAWAQVFRQNEMTIRMLIGTSGSRRAEARPTDGRKTNGHIPGDGDSAEGTSESDDGEYIG